MLIARSVLLGVGRARLFVLPAKTRAVFFPLYVRFMPRTPGIGMGPT